MNGLIKLNHDYENADTMTSMQIAEITGKEHFIILRDIRDEIEKLENGGVSTDLYFLLSERKDPTGRTIPYYKLSQEGVDWILKRYERHLTHRNGEPLLRKILEGAFLDNVKCQYPTLNYKVDFYIPYLRLIVEYDEDYHKYQKEKDKKKNERNIRRNKKTDYRRRWK